MLNKNPWGNINNYRVQIMGFATLIITIMHLYVSFYEDAQIPYLTILLKRGNIGVDIFLMLSGCGLYYSMSKSPKLLEFYKKRMNRVLVPYLVLSIFYWIVLDFIVSTNIIQFLEDYSLISFWTSGVTHYWYVAFIIPIYLLYPLIFKLQQKKSSCIIALCFLSIVCSGCIAYFNPDYYSCVEIAITRIPAFLMGSYLGEILRGKKEKYICVFNIYFILSFFLFLISVLISESHRDTADVLYRYGSAGAGLFLILILCWVMECSNKRLIKKTVWYFGDISLELYIVSQTIRNSIIALEIGTPLNVVFKFIIETIVFALSICISKMYRNSRQLNFNK